MPAIDIPNVGRIAMVADPQGAPFYVMKPIPPAGQENAAKRRLLARPAAARSRWNELSTTDPGGRPRTSTASSSAGARTTSWTWARWANTASSRPSRARPSARSCRSRCSWPAAQVALLYRRRRSIAAAEGDRRGQGRNQSTWARTEVPSGDCDHIGIDPQGAEFAPRRRAQVRRKYHDQQTDHLPVVRQRRGAQGRRILRVGFPRQPASARRTAAPSDFPGRRAGRRADGRVHRARPVVRRPQRRPELQAQRGGQLHGPDREPGKRPTATGTRSPRTAARKAPAAGARTNGASRGRSRRACCSKR